MQFGDFFSIECMLTLYQVVQGIKPATQIRTKIFEIRAETVGEVNFFTEQYLMQALIS